MDVSIVKHLKDPEHKVTPVNQLGRFGMLHKEYLKGYSDSLYEKMILQGNLYVHCLEVQERAEEMMDDLVSEMEKSEGVTEELKRKDPFKWLKRKMLILNRSEEIVLKEVIYRI
ncbi:MAG: TnpV protein [Lachnospiraceae bacterium]|nr:TnpV protein [Lachnospiraceae bacterium]